MKHCTIFAGMIRMQKIKELCINSVLCMCSPHPSRCLKIWTLLKENKSKTNLKFKPVSAVRKAPSRNVAMSASVDVFGFCFSSPPSHHGLSRFVLAETPGPPRVLIVEALLILSITDALAGDSRYDSEAFYKADECQAPGSICTCSICSVTGRH